MKSKSTTAILALLTILLGGIGIHRFYLGQTGLGFVYLLFFWTGVPFVISIIDFITFLTMSEAGFNLKYNQKPVMQVQQVVNSNPVSATNEIEKLHELKEKGAITEDEYQIKKEKLL